MERIEKSIEVHVPVHTAYNQWTQFEEFPRFMEGIEEVRQTDDRHVHWVAEIGGKRKEWDSEISLQDPDRCVAWRSVSGAANNGRVEFSAVSPDATRVTVKMEYDPEGVVENIGDMLGVTSSRVEGDLERFRDFVESRGRETGAWRGKIGKGTGPRSGGTATGMPSDGPGQEQVTSGVGVSMPDSSASSTAASRAGSSPAAVASASGAGDYARHDPAFRTDFDQNYAAQGGRYEDYRDAYYYGCALRERRNTGAWADLEGDARRDWESKQPGTWERFKNAIRRGWEEITGNA